MAATSSREALKSPALTMSAAGWTDFLADLARATAGSNREAGKLATDGLRDLELELNRLRALLQRPNLPKVTIQVWSARQALLNRRAEDLRKLLPVRLEGTVHGTASGQPVTSFSDATADRLRQRVAHAIETLSRLRYADLSNDMRKLIPEDLAGRRLCGRRPTEAEISSMWLVVIGWSVAVVDPVARRILWMRGEGHSLRHIGAAIHRSATWVATKEANALAALEAWMLRHGVG